MIYGNCEDFTCKKKDSCLFFRDDMCDKVRFCHVAFPRVPQCSFCLIEKSCPVAKKNNQGKGIKINAGF